jgi:coenzyme Q-binding protein COQ10
MAEHSERRELAFNRERIFDLVADVERYPEFLPAWQEARIYRRDGDVYYTEQVIGRGPVRERFRSRTTLRHPTQIQVEATDDLFRHFDLLWEFQDAGEQQCRVDFSLRAEARSRLFQRVLDILLTDMARSIVSAFEKRATELYGPGAA